jgi:peptidoglycan/LPS O-acetylase OafA/YrhL
VESPNRKYLPAIDHLRAFAALLILYYHGYHMTYWPLVAHHPFQGADWVSTRKFLLAPLIEAHTAVSLFLVISGFILTFGSLDDHLNVRAFFRNRALRILPLLLAVVLFGTYVYHRVDLIPILQTLSQLGGGVDLPPFTGATWTVAVEAQMYLIFPFVVKQLRANNIAVLIKIVGLAYLVRLAGLGLRVDVRNLAYWTTLGHIEQFLAGAVVAWWIQKHNSFGKLAGRLLPVFTLLVLATFYGFHLSGGFPGNQPWRIFFPTVEALVWSGFLLSYLNAAHLVPPSISRPLDFVGKISYSIYLLHLTVVLIFTTRGWYFNIPGWTTLSILLSTTFLYLPPTLLASWLTYTLIEKPFLDLRKRYVNSPVSLSARA